MRNQSNNPFVHDEYDDFEEEDDNEEEEEDPYHDEMPIDTLHLNSASVNELMKWENIRKAQLERSQDHENYFSEMNKTMDGFHVTANYFGKTVVVK